MLELYWGCLIVGALYVLVSVIFGDIIGGALDGLLDFLSSDGASMFNPMTIVGGVTIFGGSGIMLNHYTSLEQSYIFLLSLLIALFMSILIYFFYVRPMSRAENSTGYSMSELVGNVGEIVISIPQGGYGEVMMNIGMGTIHHIAGSYEGASLEAGQRVVVVEVKDGVLLVVPFDAEYHK